MAVVDLDDQESWPAGVVDLAHSEARRLDGTTEYYTDLRVVQDHDLLADLSGHKLRAFHSTRLLDAEVSAIRETGLVALSEHLIATRLGYAVAAGALSPKEAEVIASEHLLNDLDGRGARRAGQVCFVFGKSVFVDDLDGLSPLLGHWGGEAIYFAYRERDPRALRLRRIGQPAVVVAHLDLAVGGIHNYQVDRLLKGFVGRVLGFERVAPEFHYFADVPSGDIESVLRPGDMDYAALGDMPSHLTPNARRPPVHPHPHPHLAPIRQVRRPAPASGPLRGRGPSEESVTPASAFRRARPSLGLGAFTRSIHQPLSPAGGPGVSSWQ